MDVGSIERICDTVTVNRSVSSDCVDKISSECPVVEEKYCVTLHSHVTYQPHQPFLEHDNTTYVSVSAPARLVLGPLACVTCVCSLATLLLPVPVLTGLGEPVPVLYEIYWSRVDGSGALQTSQHQHLSGAL